MKKYTDEELEILKEEKRREKLQKALEAEKAVCRAAIYSFFIEVFDLMVRAGKRIKARLISIYSFLPEFAVKLKRFFRGVQSILKWFLVKLTDFTRKRYSAPLFCFAVFALYTALIYGKGIHLFDLHVHMSTMHYYLCDFKVGFCSKLLIGAIISLFTDKVSLDLMDGIVKISIILLFAVQSLIVGLLLRRSVLDRSCYVFAMGLFAATSPMVIFEHLATPGLLDVFLFLLFFLWIPFVKKTATIIVTPLFCMLGMTIHYVFALAFLPPMLTLLFYYAICSEDRKTRIVNKVTLFSSGFVSAGSFCYFVLFAKNHLRMTSDAFYQYMLSRLNAPKSVKNYNTLMMGHPIFKEYFDYYLFGEYDGKNYYDSFGSFITFLKNWSLDNFNRTVLYNNLIFFCGIFILAVIIWSKCIRHAHGIRRLPYFGFIAQMFVIVAEVFLSTDIWRWTATTFISQLVVFFVVYSDHNSFVYRTISLQRPRRSTSMIVLSVSVGYAVYCLSMI